MNIEDIKICLETLSEVIPQVSEESRNRLFNTLAILKKEYVEISNMNTYKKTDDSLEDLINDFKSTIEELNKKLKSLGYGTRGYILTYQVSKVLAGIDVYKIQKEMSQKYSKNKASNLLRSLALYGESYLRDVLDIAKSINDNPEEYVKYLNENNTELKDNNYEINISSRADSIITAEMVEKGAQCLEKYFKENQILDDEIPF